MESRQKVTHGRKQKGHNKEDLFILQKHCKLIYLNWKANRKERTQKDHKKNTRKKISLTYHVIMSIVSFFYFVASIKLLALISG